jgi:hypothetical protein
MFQKCAIRVVKMSVSRTLDYTYLPSDPDGSPQLVVSLPVSAADPGVLDVLVAYGDGNGATEDSPIVLQVNEGDGSIVDDTTQVFGSQPGALPNPRNVTLLPGGAGQTYIVFAEQGLDQGPWPGAIDTLYAWNGSTLVDDNSLLPSSLAYSHDVSSGNIDAAGDFGLFGQQHLQ